MLSIIAQKEREIYRSVDVQALKQEEIMEKLKSIETTKEENE